MKGVITKTAGAPYEIVEDIEKPKAGQGQILVKSIATAINPVDSFMIQGTLVSSFPMVLGCDASGVVVEVGEGAESSFKIGDRVCGCTRLGEVGYGTFQEYFIMDARLAIPTPERLSFQQAASIGVGVETAALGLFDGLQINLPDPKVLPKVKDEWVLVLGGAGSVGQYTVQLAKLSGNKVVATCSTKSASVVQSLGADAIIDYRKSEEDQLADLKEVTKGNLLGAYDTTAKTIEFGMKVLKDVSTAPKRYFATTNDWTPIEAQAQTSVYQVQLGLIGKSGQALGEKPNLNDDIASYIPVIRQLIEDGQLKPNEVNEMEKGGFEGVPDAYALQQKGTSGGKVVVTLQQP